ncbi:MAG: hypothetical protein D6689_14330 [Deltaproteobacteria bacterium]|nr:MAG: hypothetical protein D6689_14330 [Deltaproteobacteria bacterium]
MAVAAALAPARVRAQSNFVPADEETEEQAERTRYDARVTSTTFAYRETGAIAPALAAGTEPPESASPINRLFTDLRLQVSADHISGGHWDARVDVRGRFNQLGSATSRTQDADDARIPTQSGMFGNRTELEVRDLFMRRRGRRTTWTFGRQTVVDVAATKIDGVRVVFDKNRSWDYVAFAGLYPARGSRSIRDDYPQQAPDPTAADPMARGARVVPVAVGAAAAYRRRSAHGAVGAGAIVPRAADRVGGQLEPARVFVTANGYWRRSTALDLYHYVVVDLQSARDSVAFNNVVLGADWHPRFTFRINASIVHVDTETLNAQAKAHLEEPDPNTAAAGARIQNNAEVLRIASEAARVAVSSSFRDMRFELSAIGQLRRRPEFTVIGTDGTPYTFPKSQAADVTLQAVDRRSVWGMRFAGSVTRIVGVGDANFNHSKATIARLTGSRRFEDGRTEVEVSAQVLASSDDTAGAMGATCPAGTLDPLACLGTSSVTSVQLGALAFRQLSSKWYAVATAYVGRYGIASADAMGTRVDQPPITFTSAFLRLDYRFR